MPLSVGDKLGPYELVAQIGVGGMGVVFRARDSRLHRDVAIKIAGKEFSSRFGQEARSVAALNHPNICQIFDIGQDYLVLEYVEGSPIRGPMKVEEAVKIAIQIASALEEAHGKGILHRDLKPGNILITPNGITKLLDFGLAKSMAASDTDVTQTREGAIVGTAAYMSPEQAEGGPLDARSDVFSFGIVLYELLSGKRAFSGNSTAEVLSAILRDTPPPLAVPAALQRIVARCISKKPQDRIASMSEVRAALEGLLGKANDNLPSIAVLPFANMSRNTEDEYFSDGLAEEILNALTQIRGLKVIARTSAFAFKGKNEDIRGIAEALGVTNVLEGSVRRVGNRIRITAQLIQAEDGTHLWSQRYDREMTDIFAIQDEISAAIADHLKLHFKGGERQTTNILAYEAYLEGRHHWAHLSPDAVAKALQCYERAIALDPGYAPAHVGISEYYLSLALLGLAKATDLIPKIQASARKALELDENSADAYAMLAQVSAFLYRWEESKAYFTRALQLEGSSTRTAQPYILWYLMPLGLLDEALALIDNSLNSDPLSFLHCLSKSRILIGLRRSQDALEWAGRSVEINPGYFFGVLGLADALAANHQFDSAIATAEQVIHASGRWTWPLYLVGSVHAMAGHSSQTHQVIEELHQFALTNHVPPGLIATLYAQLGEKSEAFRWANKAIEQYDPLLILYLSYWKLYDAFDSVCSDIRYTEMRKRVGL